MGSLVAELAEKLSSATNNFDIDEGTIYVNTSADTVAIGGTSPDGKFSIHQSGTDDILNLYDGTTAVFTVLDGGNVGIGTTTPAKQLSVYRTSSVTSNGALFLDGNGNYAGLQFAASGTTYGSIAPDTTALILSHTSGLLFKTGSGTNVGGSERMKITSDGKVGIGTTSPSYPLDVSGTSINVASMMTTIQLQSTNAYNSNPRAGIIAKVKYNTGGDLTEVAGIDFGKENGTDGNYAGNMSFHTRANGSSIAQAMTISSAGYVGIGTSAPVAALSIEGNNNTTSEITLKNTSPSPDAFWAITAVYDQDSLAFRSVNNTYGNRLLLTADGALTLTASEGSSASLYLVADEGDDNGDGWRINSNQDANDLTISSNTSGSYADKVTILTNGRVGIGESSPAFLLHVAGTLGIKDTQPTLTLDRGGAYAWTIRNGDGSGSFPLSTLNVANNSGSPVMTFQDDGDVGIGTTAPTYPLHVLRNTNNFVTQIHNSGTSGNVYGFRVYFASNPDDNTSKAIEFATSGGDKFQVFSDGDVKNHDGAYGTISDERIKTDIVDANSQWDDVKAVRVRNFKKKDDVATYGDKAWSQIGVVAQELEKVSPKLVKEYPPSEWEMEHCGFGKKVGGKWVPKQVSGKDMTVKGVSYSILQMKAFKALQEAMAKIETLEAKVKTLEDAG